MEPLGRDCPTSSTDIINVEDLECRTPSPITSDDESNCTFASIKREIAITEAAIEERNDVMLRLMGHLIPDSTGLEGDSASETDNSITSSPSTLKRRLHDLPQSSEAVKLADRVAALNRRMRRERDLYLHLQGLSNRIEEKDEVDNADSSKTINSSCNSNLQGQISDARARRRKRLNPDSWMSQSHLSFNRQHCASGFSSPESLRLTEVCEDSPEEMSQFSSLIKDRYCNFEENDSADNLLRGNPSMSQEFEDAEETFAHHRNSSQFSHETHVDETLTPVENISDHESSTAMVDHGRASDFDFEHYPYLKDGLIHRSVSPGPDDDEVQPTPSSTASSSLDIEYAYRTRKSTPKKFGGYRPAPGLIFRNLSSDSEPEGTADRTTLRSSELVSRNFIHSPSRIMEIEEFPCDEVEIIEGKQLSPIISADSRLCCRESGHSQKLQSSSETGTAQMPPIENEHHVSDNAELVEHRTPVEGSSNQHDEDQTMDGFEKEKHPHTSGNACSKVSENSSEQGHDNEANLSERSARTTTPSSSRNGQTQILGSRAGKLNPCVSNLSTKDSRDIDHLLVPASLRSLSENEDKTEDHRVEVPEHRIQDESTFVQEFDAGTECSRVTESDGDVLPKIPPLEIESQNYSQCHSSASENRDEMMNSKLDVHALIQALSNVSLKQENATVRTNRLIVKQKSPFAYGNRFSESSGPRSSEYTPAVPGSRQSLTSLEVSEARSLKNSKANSSARCPETPLLKSNEGSAIISSTRLPETSEKLSGPSLRSKDFSPLAVDPSDSTSFIPVVAKVNRTNLVCSKHSLRIKSSGKLISPRKYPRTNFGDEIPKPLTSRTEALQSSPRSRKSFRSLKSAPFAKQVHEKRNNDSRLKSDSYDLRAPVSGRRVLEPLNAVPKIQQDVLANLNRKLNRRRKTANDLAQIIKQTTDESETEMANVARRSPARRSPRSRSNRPDLPVPRFARRFENSTVQKKKSPRTRNKGKKCEATDEPSLKQELKLRDHPRQGKNYSNISSEESYMTSGNVSSRPTRKSGFIESPECSGRLSTRSGDCVDRMRCSEDSRGETFFDHDAYKTEGVLHDQQKTVNALIEKMCAVMQLDAERIKVSDSRSAKTCVHLDNLQDGREVRITCRDSKCRDENLHQSRELFQRLPSEISAALTRHSSFDSQVAENLHCSKELVSTIEHLGRNIQKSNAQWIKDFKSDNDSREATYSVSELSTDDSQTLPKKCDVNKSSSASSPATIRHDEFRSFIQSPTSIHPKTSGGSSCVSNKIDPGSSEDSSSFYGNMRLDSEYNSESAQLDSSPNSYQNTYRILEERRSNDGVAVRHVATSMGEPSLMVSPIIKNDQAETAERRNLGERDVEVLSSTARETNEQKFISNAPFSLDTLNSITDTDEDDQKLDDANRLPTDRTTDDNSIPNDDVDEDTIPSEVVQFASRANEVVTNSSGSFTPSRCPAEVKEKSISHSEDLRPGSSVIIQKNIKAERTCFSERSPLQSKKLGDSGEDCEQRSTDTLKEDLEDRSVTRQSDSGFGACGEISTPSSTKSSKSHPAQEPITSSPASIKSLTTMPKANSNWDIATITGVNSVQRRSQDRFPFTISESASWKASKFKIGPDVSLGHLIQEQTAQGERNVAVLGQLTTSSKPTGDEETTLDFCESQRTPFLNNLTRKLSSDSLQNWNTQTLFSNSNYMSYGCSEEPRTLMPNVKEIVKKFSTKLRCARTKRCQDHPEEAQVKILYRNRKCHCESGEVSSSATSLFQSRFFADNPTPSLSIGSTDVSRASSGKKPKRNHECTSLSISGHVGPRKSYDKDDLWIQEFDSDVEFARPDTMPHTSSPVDDRYAKFLARRQTSNVPKDDDLEGTKASRVPGCREDGDTEKVACRKRDEDQVAFSEVQDVGQQKGPRTPAKSYVENIAEFEHRRVAAGFADSAAETGCCCLRISKFFASFRRSSKPSKRRPKARRRIEFVKN